MNDAGLESDKFISQELPGLTTIAEQHEPEEAIQELRRGALCPRCGQGKLDYDGMLNFSCPSCGFTLSGCFT